MRIASGPDSPIGPLSLSGGGRRQPFVGPDGYVGTRKSGETD